MENILKMVKFDDNGLVPVVAQDVRTDEVLMLAYMNKEALAMTLRTGKAHYYSRSRRKLWLKGETSGHFQKVRSISVDCDGDTLLLRVEQTGQACHTGHYSCFYTRMEPDGRKAEGLKQIQAANETHDAYAASAAQKPACTAVTADDAAGRAYDSATLGKGISTHPSSGDSGNVCPGPGAHGIAASAPYEGQGLVSDVSPAGPEILGEVFKIIKDRLAHPKEGSYTNYLFSKGLDKILKKIGEEACEVVIASKNGNPEEIGGEIADLLYHLLVLLAEKGMTPGDIYKALAGRK